MQQLPLNPLEPGAVFETRVNTREAAHTDSDEGNL